MTRDCSLRAAEAGSQGTRLRPEGGRPPPRLRRRSRRCLSAGALHGLTLPAPSRCKPVSRRAPAGTNALSGRRSVECRHVGDKVGATPQRARGDAARADGAGTNATEHEPADRIVALGASAAASATASFFSFRPTSPPPSCGPAPDRAAPELPHQILDRRTSLPLTQAADGDHSRRGGSTWPRRTPSARGSGTVAWYWTVARLSTMSAVGRPAAHLACEVLSRQGGASSSRARQDGAEGVRLVKAEADGARPGSERRSTPVPGAASRRRGRPRAPLAAPPRSSSRDGRRRAMSSAGPEPSGLRAAARVPAPDTRFDCTESSAEPDAALQQADERRQHVRLLGLPLLPRGGTTRGSESSSTRS